MKTNYEQVKRDVQNGSKGPFALRSSQFSAGKMMGDNRQGKHSLTDRCDGPRDFTAFSAFCTTRQFSEFCTFKIITPGVFFWRCVNTGQKQIYLYKF